MLKQYTSTDNQINEIFKNHTAISTTAQSFLQKAVVQSIGANNKIRTVAD